MKKMLDTLKTYAGIVTAVFSALVVLFAMFSFINKANETNKVTDELKCEVDKIIMMEERFMVRFDSLAHVTTRTELNVKASDKKLTRLITQFRGHLSDDKDITKEELIEIMDQILRENENSKRQ